MRFDPPRGMQRRMKLNQLRLLAAVANAGSIQKAAHACNISQPAVSKAIRDLERELGVDLLERGASGATLTAYGAIVLKRMAAVEKEIGYIREEIDWLRGERGGQVVVGLSPPSAGLGLAAAIARFSIEQPGIGVRLLELRPAQILEGLRTGSLDIGILHQYGAGRTLKFDSMLLHSFQTALVIGGDYPEERVSMNELARMSWLAGDMEDDANGYIEVLVREAGLSPPPRIVRCTSIGLYLGLARQKGFVSHWPEPALEHLESQFRARYISRLHISGPLPSMGIVLAFREEALLSPSAATLLRALRMLEGRDG